MVRPFSSAPTAPLPGDARAPDTLVADALALSFLPGITPRRVTWMRETGCSFAEILSTRGDGYWTTSQMATARACADRALQEAHRQEVAVVPLGDPRYPHLLECIPDAPLVLYVRGPLHVCAPVAVVGARRADAYGRTMAEQFTRTLGDAGCTIVSGLAWGVDASAHRAALAKPGRTIAVLGTGVDRVYPRDHAPLAAEILGHGGTLVSELPLGTGARAGHFPKRNRIIAGLAHGTLVVQAGLKSGSLITARLALEYDRFVWAVPNRVGDPLAAGVHALLREGALAVTAPADILEDLSPSVPEIRRATAEKIAITHARDPFLATLQPTGSTVQELAASTGRTHSEVLGLLLRAELQGTIRAEPGGIYRLTG